MPKQYKAIRDALVKQGMDYDQAQEKAAKIYNSLHKRKMGGKKKEK